MPNRCHRQFPAANRRAKYAGDSGPRDAAEYSLDRRFEIVPGKLGIEPFCQEILVLLERDIVVSGYL